MTAQDGSALATAVRAAQVMRDLNDATGTAEGLPDLEAVREVLDSIRTLLDRLSQTLGHIGQRCTALATDPRAVVIPNPYVSTPTEALDLLQNCIEDAAQLLAVEVAGFYLRSVQGMAGTLHLADRPE